MFRRLTLIAVVIAAAAALSGCSKCDFWGDGYRTGACKTDTPPR